MSAQLGIQGHIIELEEEIAYNFQVGNIADFSKLKSNYTSAFKIPKTIDVVRLFEGLGIPSDTSTVPYRINNVDCLDDYSIVYSGTLVVLKTDELYYHSTVISGVYDLATVLGDATLFDITEDILSIKEPAAVYSGLMSAAPIPPYTRFIFADYGGIRQINNASYDADIFAESVFLSEVINRVFQHVGYAYSYPSSIDLTNEMVVLPTPPLSDYTEEGTLGGNYIKSTLGSDVGLNSGQEPGGAKDWSLISQDISMFQLQNNQTEIVCQQPGLYLFRFENFVAWMYQGVGTIPDRPRYGMRIQFYLNGLEAFMFYGETAEDPDRDHYTRILRLFSGDTITYNYFTPPQLDINTNRRYALKNAGVRISSIGINYDKLKNIINFKLTDFIKEFAYRYMLTPVQEGNNVTFISLYDTLENWDVVDWTDKYIGRKEETYTLDYAQNNWLRHSYVNEGDDYYDLNLQSNNLNAPVNKDIVKSKIFSPNQNLGYEIYDQTEDNNGIKTKTNNRIFFTKRIMKPVVGDLFISSRSVPSETYKIDSGVFINYAEYTAGFNQSERWESLRSIIEDTRVHLIDLNLSIVDVTQIDFSKVYYFEQEASYYILNNLKYTKGKVTTAEFVKVRPKDPVWYDLLISYSNYAEYPLQVSTPYNGTIDIPANWSGNFSIKRKDDEDYIITVTPHRPGGMILDITIDDGDGYHDNFWAEDTPRAIPKTIVEPVYMDFELGS